MPGSTNFKRFDLNLSNLLTDAQYTSDTMRQGGAVSGVFPKETFNKLALQLSHMVAALATMLANKGYTVEDGSAGTAGHDFDALTAILANIMTTNDTIAKALDANTAGGIRHAIARIASNGSSPFSHNMDSANFNWTVNHDPTLARYRVDHANVSCVANVTIEDTNCYAYITYNSSTQFDVFVKNLSAQATNAPFSLSVAYLP